MPLVFQCQHSVLKSVFLAVDLESFHFAIVYTMQIIQRSDIPALHDVLIKETRRDGYENTINCAARTLSNANVHTRFQNICDA